jgi:glycosyltransferase involved in cell wall biosynthesis
MDGLITLTNQLAKHYAPSAPSLLLEGILSGEDYCVLSAHQYSCNVRTRSSFNILYAGGLTAEYGVGILLKAFSYINDKDIRLWVLGKGPLSDEIQKASYRDNRIVYKGYCSQKEVIKLYQKASVLINPRPSKQSFTKFSFPSKTIEYMASGRPVISTRLPGIPEEYFKYLIPLENESPEGLSNLLMELKAMSPKELEQFGENGRYFIIQNKCEAFQGNRILRFLKQIVSKKKDY